ncbi:Quinic acid utilization activator [Penicillium diatomitis]|uniref:Quinic acid utilization activator n=1 Tax=Penicillium diatomitis TaxID=2819901 RepID=A0A9W9XDI2_9EURO|nr:Quinic acid utilization activator [Penicillium diatomitis]KAJ5489226.1 Quinic acid utilization activator [Penicillium diatomitis]
MTSEPRQVTGPNGKTKRRLNYADNEGKANTPQESALPKRQRVSRACDNCRSKKDKCDGAQPVCSTCASLGRQCTYKANPKKRGLPTGYIRSLELLWGLVFQKIPGSEDVMRALMRSTDLLGRLAAMGKDAEGSDTLHASFKNSALLRDIERMLVVLEQPEEDKERLTCPPSDAGTPLDIDRVLASAEAQEWHIPEGIDRLHNLPIAISPSCASQQTIAGGSRSHRTEEAAVQTESYRSEHSLSDVQFNVRGLSTRPSQQAFELPSNGWSLLDVYFTYTQCWFPILEKHDMLRIAYQYAEGPLSMSSDLRGSGDHAALWAVLALASFQDGANNSTHSPSVQSRPRNATQLSRIARSLIPAEACVQELGHVQALLILSLISLGQQRWTTAWMLIGQAIRSVQLLGLDQPSPRSACHNGAKSPGRTQHVFLGCFLLETLIAEHMSQRPSLRKEDLTRVGAIGEDGLEEWHPWEDQTGFRSRHSFQSSMQRGPIHALSTFNRLLSLISILNELCFLKQDPTASRAHFESLDVQLQRWVTSLPKRFRVNMSNRHSSPPSPHLFNLEVLYQSTVTSLSLQIASRQGDNNHIIRLQHTGKAIESSRTLLELLQFFMEAFSYKATTPLFGIAVSRCLTDSASQVAPGVHDSDLRSSIGSLNSHLRQLWIASDSYDGTEAGGSESQEDVFPSETQALQHHSTTHAPTPQDLVPATNLFPDLNDHSHRPPDFPLLDGWARNARSTNENCNPFQTPRPSMASMGGVAEASTQADQFNGGALSAGSAISQSQRSSLNCQSALPYGGQYPAYGNPSPFNQNPFIEVDRHETARRQTSQRIAPDLDALFDELASLDGADRQVKCFVSLNALRRNANLSLQIRQSA